MSSPNSLPAVPLSRDTHERLMVEAYRRCQPGEDVRDRMRALVERALAATLGQLEAEEVDPGRPPLPRFADGTMPGTEKRHNVLCRCGGAFCAQRATP